MNAGCPYAACAKRQSGFSYLEVLIATVIIAVALVPAIDALYAGMLGARVYDSSSKEYYLATTRMEEVLAEPHVNLKAAAALAGNAITPSSYSDPTGSTDRRLVFLGLYDPENKDGDNDPFTVPDPDLDNDNNPFTGYVGLIWVRVQIEGSAAFIESLSAP